MNTKYAKNLKNVLSGDINTAAKAIHEERDLWQASVEESLQRQLIATRLALKSGNTQIYVESLDENKTENIFLKGEILFVKGTYFGQTFQHREAALNFLKAAVFYKLAKAQEKEVLARFNQIIAQSYETETDLEVETESIIQLLQLCELYRCEKVKFLCRRHQSFRLFENKNYAGAIEILEKTIASNDTISKSDRELAILHIADCLCELGENRKALTQLDQIPSDIDERVRFPKALVEAKIFKTKINIEDFTVVSDHWRMRFETYHAKSSLQPATGVKADLRWNAKSGHVLRGRSPQGKIKAQSLEGQILRLLMSGPKTKAHLCEALWPSSLETDFLDDRFHQLVQRINRKITELIHFDGQFYKLSKSIQAFS